MCTLGDVSVWRLSVSSYSDTFVGGIGELYNGIKDSGAKFIGLPLDDINEDDKTDTRIEAWIAAITPEM